MSTYIVLLVVGMSCTSLSLSSILRLLSPFLFPLFSKLLLLHNAPLHFSLQYIEFSFSFEETFLLIIGNYTSLVLTSCHQ